MLQHGPSWLLAGQLPDVEHARTSAYTNKKLFRQHPHQRQQGEMVYTLIDRELHSCVLQASLTFSIKIHADR